MTIELDPDHGANPGMELCFFCNEPKGVVLWGRLNPRQRAALEDMGAQDGKAPREIVLNTEPCSTCEAHMKKGIILISYDPDKTADMRNPWRSGGWVVVRDEFVERISADWGDTLERRAAFVDDEVWDALGLPRGAR